VWLFDRKYINESNMITIKTSTLIHEKIKTASGTGTETAQKLQSHMFTCIQVVELKLNITKI
jgi:hypothetical protein